MKKILVFPMLIVLSIHFFSTVNAQKTECPPEGSSNTRRSLTESEKEFNRKKNKSAHEPNHEPKVLSINDILKGENAVQDRDSFQEGVYVEIRDAYLMSFGERGEETCNCKQAKESLANGDVHINLCTKKNLSTDNNDYTFIVEITPSYKALHPEYKSQLPALKHKKVTVRGYLFYDYEHTGNAINYCKKCTKNGVWRKTCWEIHPVTYIAETTE